MRYEGTDCALMVTPQETVVSSCECKHGNFGTTFTERFVEDLHISTFWNNCHIRTYIRMYSYICNSQIVEQEAQS